MGPSSETLHTQVEMSRWGRHPKPFTQTGLMQRSKPHTYWITSSARAKNVTQRKSASTAVNSMVNVTTTIVVACKSCVLQTWPEASATSPWGPVRAESAKLKTPRAAFGRWRSTNIERPGDEPTDIADWRDRVPRPPHATNSVGSLWARQRRGHAGLILRDHFMARTLLLLDADTPQVLQTTLEADFVLAGAMRRSSLSDDPFQCSGSRKRGRCDPKLAQGRSA